jgi:peptide-methionine (R)-S-oxide reductase
MPPLDWNTVMQLSKKGNKTPDRRVEKTAEQWHEMLTHELFRVARQHGTESPFSSGLCEGVTPGKYHCACCNELLFDAATKFNSGTGWPSFNQPVTDNVINYILDESHGMIRIEAQCAVCDAHLGHVFPDGGGDTGLRFCINGVCLNKETNEQ